ncbi:hypothetical protein [Cytobacillus sp. FSL R5-0596]
MDDKVQIFVITVNGIFEKKWFIFFTGRVLDIKKKALSTAINKGLRASF